MHPVLHGIAGGEKQYRGVQAGLAHGLEDLPAVTAGQHHVENQQVVVAGQGEELAGLAVGGQFGGEAGLVQALAQVLAGTGLVFDDQQFHWVN
ncbi:hypothetical protein D3C76_579980 [compost metagenome]